MLKNLRQHIVLWVQAKTGLTAGFFAWLTVAGGAAGMLFIFLCVTGYEWLSIELGAVFGGLAMAGIFLLIAIIGTVACTLSRRRTRQRAVLDRAARTQGLAGRMIDPKVLNVALEAGRALGWQRIVSAALLGFLVAQWAQEARGRDTPD